MKSRILVILFCLHLCSRVSPAQEPHKAQSEPPVPVASTAALPSGTEQIRKTVAFIGVNYQNGSSALTAIGTCFFVSIPDERWGKNGQFIYLVTNRHVAQPRIDLGTPYQIRGASMRMNLTNPQGDVQSVAGPLPLGPDFHWYFSSDDAVGLAVLPIAPDIKRFDYMVIPLNSITNAAQMKSYDLGVGDSITLRITFVGLMARAI